MDKRWIQGCPEGDTLTIEQLVDSYQERIYRLVLFILDATGPPDQ